MGDIVAVNFKRFRTALGYTQEELSEALGITRSTYSNYESGEREMPYDIIDKVSDLFGCEPYMFFEDNKDTEDMILASAFRLDNLSQEDLKEIMHFKDIVKSYLKMERIYNTQK